MSNNNKSEISSNLTFVIQGPIITENNITRKSCDSIRKYFPDSKIILSTWKNSNLDDINNVDDVIQSNDPGADQYYYKNNKLLNNINRMLLSSLNGLNNSKSKFSIKLRSDMYFQSNNLLNFTKFIDESDSPYTKKKIVIPSNMALNPDKKYKLLFHPSDCFFFGLTEDLIDLFNIPPMDKKQMTYFDDTNIYPEDNFPIRSRYTCEQYLFCSFLKKKIELDFDNAFDFSKKNKLIHDKVFSNLFLMYSNKRIGLNCYKYPMNFYSSTLYYAYTENEFKRLSGKGSKIDFERLISNIVILIKRLLHLLPKNFYYKIKELFIKKFI